MLDGNDYVIECVETVAIFIKAAYAVAPKRFGGAGVLVGGRPPLSNCPSLIAFRYCP